MSEVPNDVRAARAIVRKEVAHELGKQNLVSVPELSKMMMLPGDSHPIRVPSVDMPAVSITKLRTINYFTEESTGSAFSEYAYIALVYGHPSLNYMDGPYAYAASGFRYFKFNRVDAVSGGLSTTVASLWDLKEVYGKASPWNEDPKVWWPAVAMSNGDPQQSAFRPLLEHDGITWAFFNAGENIVIGGYGSAVTWSGLAPTGNLRFGIYFLTGEDVPPQWLYETTVSFSEGGITQEKYEIEQCGWYAVRFEEASVTTNRVATASIAVTYDFRQADLFWKLVYNEELGQYRAIAQNSRRTAASLLVTNRTNALQAQGNVVAARVDATMPGFRIFEDFKSNLTKAQDKFSGKALTGCYTYMEFTNKDELFNDFVNEHGYPVVRLSDNMVNVITVANSNTPNTYAVIYDTIIEFKTTSQLFPRSVSTMDAGALIETRRINNMTTYFYDNPIHWEDIQKYIGRMWKWARQHSVTLGGAASMLAPELAPAIMPVAKMLQLP